eukprot:CAMPEP_0205827036 /NCGR_PEP_ID=MMETSP0206-20130828/30619_1 /ASSEMBLY_ACC=CAM_ASM_000279 /TAXON_ID=36767 /ORGANISM="Euplotes focardii, Strain TN1" /LENGTH=59 /DNA_ID=CAMNT_0053127523 /DNA_START=166 /DNA_END=342 /DNA_ORIENTATION=+
MANRLAWTTLILAVVLASAQRSEAAHCQASSCADCVASVGCGFCELEGGGSFCSPGAAT